MNGTSTGQGRQGRQDAQGRQGTQATEVHISSAIMALIYSGPVWVLVFIVGIGKLIELIPA